MQIPQKQKHLLADHMHHSRAEYRAVSGKTELIAHLAAPPSAHQKDRRSKLPPQDNKSLPIRLKHHLRKNES